jgi:3-oxoadipate enol-lactonase
VSAAVELAHEVDGPAGAPVLVLGNSIGSTRAMWDAQHPALRERFRVVRYDARGHGASPVPPGPYAIADLGRDVLALLDRLGVERASFAGLSLGGMTGMWLGAHAPERIERLVLLCTRPHYADTAAWHERAALVRADGAEAVAGATMERWFTEAFRRDEPAVVAVFRAGVAATPAEGYAGCCEAIAALDLRGDLAAIRAPTLVIAGAHDPSAPPDAMREIADGIAGARFEVVPAAHLANVEQPEAVTTLIADHVQQGSQP